jgi:hypothetical protein
MPEITVADLLGDRFVDLKEQLVEVGVGEKSVTHWICLPRYSRNLETAPSDDFRQVV